MFLILLASLIGAALLPLAARLIGRGAGLVISLLPFGLLAAFLSLAPIVERGWVRGEGRNWAPWLGADITLRLDGFSFLFCLLITGIGGLVTIYAGGYLTNKSRTDRARFFSYILLFMTAMLGTVLAENLLVLVLFWEATSIFSFLLIGFDGRSARARRAALMSLQVTALGGLALLAAVIMIGHALGSYSMAEAIDRRRDLMASGWGDAVVVCILIAAFTKSAQFPFHFWLPNAMQAPTPASAFLHSATMVKLGIYLLARFEPVIGVTGWGRSLLVTVACITMLLAAIQALRAENFKSALAYSTIASLGILVMLVGLDGPAASVAMIGFLLAHALYKAALFFCAGSVLHATGLYSLRAMGGLARFLPLTALACLGASLSMAGIPPFMGFISKEFLFQAQLESSWELAPLAIAVMVNAVMVGVAGVVTMRPFFLNRGKITEIRHGETFSLVAPPLVLALAGLTISLDPEWITRIALRPAVAAVYGRAVEVDIAVWHGVTPMLLLSAVVIATGALIVRFWGPIHLRLRRARRIDAMAIEPIWEESLRGLTVASSALTERLQHGDLRRYLAMVIGGVALLVGWSVIAAGALPRLPAAEPVRIGEAIVVLVGLASAFMAARARTLLAAMIATGLSGFAIAISFMAHGAPDLALTQFTVEALLVVLLTALLLAVPLAAPATRAPAMRGRDALIATALAGLLCLGILDMAAGEHVSAASSFFGRMSYVAARGHNVVNVILVDFRGFDTLGETMVIAVAAVLAGSLLAARSGDAPVSGPPPVHFSLAVTGRWIAGLLLVASLVILWRGHDQPGGGFVGGLVAALSFALIALAYGVDKAERTLRLSPLTLVSIGMACTLLSGLPGMASGQPFLTHLWWEPEGWLPKLGTTMIFDLGVYLVVLGAMLSFHFGLQREATR
ncbi:putative Na(+)/H(+) antiporter subunit A/B [Sphingobium sp. SYK-6]|uniref:hydrogen gas-evolving membrane-bound hydrogenase subunit E n=1 Tax=Sphingobium sp. (strain NBRC 103272 / SYK-6) TaxID=627192 RepID=UPI00022774D8|nr:hydrogen gas-evolving membrane-bound hydrogenase subunit E [Sphingobium sp. SYK-6]BAK66080.1 putative Na(+)/H(+) antiporter subunit A/B [Sphingobium sp. SYK-6]